MSARVLLHVGSPKSGTTYLQRVLRDNRELLASHGVLVAGRTHRDLVHAAMAVREDPRLERLPDEAQRAWQQLVEEIRAHPGHLAVVSYELFSVATAEQAERALADLAGLEVDVVVTARDLGRALSSAWQERLKFTLTTPLGEWQPPPEDRVRSEWGWRSLDPAGVLERWTATLPRERRHLVTTPRGGDPSRLWQRFAEIAGLDTLPVALPETRVNESLSPAAAELLRRVNVELGDRLPTGAQQARWVRDLLANRVLASLDDEPTGVPDALLAQAQATYDAMLARLEALGAVVHGDVEDLRPTQRSGERPARLPEEVPAEELTVTAVRALADLLVASRDDAVAQRAEQERAQEAQAQRGGVLDRLRDAARDPELGAVRAEAEQLRRRVVELERQIGEARALQHELAALSDLVVELLMPDLSRDDARMRDALRAYRGESIVGRADKS